MAVDDLAAVRERHIPLTRTRDDGVEQPCCYTCDTYFKACDAQRAIAAYDAQVARLAEIERLAGQDGGTTAGFLRSLLREKDAIVAEQRARLAVLERALVQALIPLEVMYAAERGGTALSAGLQHDIEQAVLDGRQVIMAGATATQEAKHVD